MSMTINWLPGSNQFVDFSCSTKTFLFHLFFRFSLRSFFNDDFRARAHSENFTRRTSSSWRNNFRAASFRVSIYGFCYWNQQRPEESLLHPQIATIFCAHRNYTKESKILKREREKSLPFKYVSWFHVAKALLSPEFSSAFCAIKDISIGSRIRLVRISMESIRNDNCQKSIVKGGWSTDE